jgi:MFS transporter, ACS family, hexuronate transporter
MSLPSGHGPSPSPIPALRWWIAATLFASTMINYLDRQTLSWLAPFLKAQYHWSNTDYAYIAISFRVAYSIGQTVFGRLIDRMGTRRGLSLAVLWYSTISVLTPLARGLYSFGLFRFLLGAGESANWPGATKAVSEWFPKQERGLATAFFDSGSSVGAALAPYLVLSIYFRWGWRLAMIVPGLLGFLWILLWRRIYRAPEFHPRITEAERQLLAQDKPDVGHFAGRTLPWSDLLKLPQTWGVIVARAFTDPIWFFVVDWFPIYLVARGIDLRSGFLAFWVPFIAADLGNFFGGTVSGWLIRRGWTLGWARKAVVIFGGIGVMLLIPTIWTTHLNMIVSLFALATFSYASFSTIANVLPADLYESSSVASVSGISGSAAGFGTVIAFFLIGRVSDLRQGTATHVFDPIMVVAGLIPFIGMILVLFLVRNTEATKQHLVHEI